MDKDKYYVVSLRRWASFGRCRNSFESIHCDTKAEAYEHLGKALADTTVEGWSIEVRYLDDDSVCGVIGETFEAGAGYRS